MSNTKVSYGEYRGKATMALLEGEQSWVNKPFSFGLKKASLILKNIDAIRDFVENNAKYQAEADKAERARQAEKEKKQVVLTAAQLEQVGNCKSAKERADLIASFIG